MNEKRQGPRIIKVEDVAELDGPGDERWIATADGRTYQLLGGERYDLDEHPVWLSTPNDEVGRSFTRLVEGNRDERVQQLEAAKRKAAFKQRPLPVNDLSRYPALGRGLDKIVQVRPPDAITERLVNEAILERDLLRQPATIFIPGRDPVADWPALIAFCGKKRIDLRVTPGGDLVARPPLGKVRVHQSVFDAIDRHQRGIVSVLTGRPIACTTTAGCERPAVTLAFPRSPWCRVCDGVNVVAEAAA